MKKHNFVTGGTPGDIVWSLWAAKELGGGNMFIRLNYLDFFVKHILHWGENAGINSGRLTQKDYDLLCPLLEAQSYLDNVSVWNGEPYDIDFQDNWRHWCADAGNQTEVYALTVGLDLNDPKIKKSALMEPWLTPVTPIKIPGKPIVVNRTDRHLAGSGGEGWEYWTKNYLGDYGVFVGLENEHAAFEERFKIKIEHKKVSDFLELAQVIQGCEMFIGNQSLAHVIAVGLGKTYYLEIRANWRDHMTPAGTPSDCWMPRLNGFHF